MNVVECKRRAACAAAVLAIGIGPLNAQAHTCAAPGAGGTLVKVDVDDRADGVTLPVYLHHGRRYVVGTPGHEYALRITNCSGRRVLAVTSVDGVNVISGETASPTQSGYVLEPWDSVAITGWRKSVDRAAAFYFTDHGDSYAARTDRPRDVGVIGVAVFNERRRVAATDEPPRVFGGRAAREAPNAPAGVEAEESRDARGPAPSSDAARGEPDRHAAQLGGNAPAARLGTGHGRLEASRVKVVRFERATAEPAETVSIRYDRRENLVAMGVLPGPHLSRREPDPFPGAMRFAPDPWR